MVIIQEHLEPFRFHPQSVQSFRPPVSYKKNSRIIVINIYSSET